MTPSIEISIDIHIELNKPNPCYDRLADLYNKLSAAIQHETETGQISLKSATKVLQYYQTKLEIFTLKNSIQWQLN